MHHKGSRVRGRGTRFEVSTSGFDPALALIQGNPYGTPTGPGLIIPGVPPEVNSYQTRYLFLLSQVQFNEGEVGRLVGIRQLLTLGATTTTGNSEGRHDGFTYPIELPVTTPQWHFSDANVSWHLRRVDPRPNATFNTNSAMGLAYHMSDTPALLYETAPPAYTPPGQPPGNILVPDLGSWQDIRFPWQQDNAWDKLDVEVKGPCRVALFASVQQTTPSTRPTINASGLTIQPGALVPEEAFLLTFGNTVVYHRIAGSLIFESHEMFYPNNDVAEWKRGGGNPNMVLEDTNAPAIRRH